MCGAPQPATEGLAYEPADGGGYTVVGIGEAQGTEIIIPATHEGEAVVAIGDEAFLGEEIESVVIPASVKSIGQYAFQKSSLKSVTLAEGLETLGYCSFSKCNSLTEFTVPASVETWGTYVFWSCENLQKVTFADGLKQVGQSAFYQCPALETVAFGGGNIQIGEKAFLECTALARVETPSIADWCSVSLKNRSYRGTTPFEYGATLYADGEPVVGTLIIPDCVTKVGENAFSWEYLTPHFTTIVIGSKVKEIGANAFGSGISKITNLFYHGEEAQWNEVVCADKAFGSFMYPSGAYFYSQAQQTGSYWHYDGSGEPVKW